MDKLIKYICIEKTTIQNSLGDFIDYNEFDIVYIISNTWKFGTYHSIFDENNFHIFDFIWEEHKINNNFVDYNLWLAFRREDKINDILNG